MLIAHLVVSLALNKDDARSLNANGGKFVNMRFS